MNVRYLLLASCLGFVGVTHAQDAPQARQELPFADCLRTDRISNYAEVDDKTLIVANGPNFYRVTTDVACPRKSLGGGVQFKGSPSVKAIGSMRICGGISEQIVRRDDPPCQIQSVEKIDKATYQQLEKNAKKKGSGAEPNGMVR